MPSKDTGLPRPPKFVKWGSGEALTFCGLQIQDLWGKGLLLHQTDFVPELLETYGMSSARGSLTPGDKIPEVEAHSSTCSTAQKAKLPVSSGGGSQVNKNPAHQKHDLKDIRAAQGIAGSIQWLSCKTRPDVAFTAHVVSSLAATDPIRSLQIAHRLLRYLAATYDRGLLYAVDDTSAARYRDRIQVARLPESRLVTQEEYAEEDAVRDLRTWVDASHAPSGGKSQLGSAGYWAGGLVSWRSTRASLTSLSSCESELQAAAMGFLLGSSVLYFLFSMGFPSFHRMKIDNTAAIANLGDSYCWRTRHLQARAGCIRDTISARELKVDYEPTSTQRADALTKHLSSVDLQTRALAMFGLKAREEEYVNCKRN